jgi:hypothetical protein
VTSDRYYRDLLIDVLDELSPMMTSPALSAARRAVDDDRPRAMSGEYWRGLLVDVLGELPPGPESMPIEAAREAVRAEFNERRRGSTPEREAQPKTVAASSERERWQAAAFWRGMGAPAAARGRRSAREGAGVVPGQRRASGSGAGVERDHEGGA